MKVSNEAKIGALTIIAVAFIFFGFNFLKGKSLFKHGNFLYAKYLETKGLAPSDQVKVNGFPIGTVFDISATNLDLDSIIVIIKLNDNYRIPSNSVAYISENPLGASSMEIVKGNSSTYLRSGDTLLTNHNAGFLGNLSNKIAPVAEQLTTTLTSLDSVLKNVNTILDPNTKNNLQHIIINLSRTTEGLAEASNSLQTLLNPNSGSLSMSLNNVNKFTKNLVDNNVKISETLSNLEETTEHLSKADIDGVVNKLKASIDNLHSMMEKINSTDGTLGAMIHDKKLYDNLNNTTRSLNILLDDLRTHPKRYISVSVFGKKDKSTPLSAPLNDSANTAPQPKSTK